MTLGWKEGIDKSNVYVIIGDDSYFKDQQLMKELDYARLVSKPFLVFLVYGTILQSTMFKGIDKIKFVNVTGKEKDSFFDNEIMVYVQELKGNTIQKGK